MKFFRAALLGGASLLCAMAVAMLVWVLTLQTTVFDRNIVKSWIQHSGIYDQLISSEFQLNFAQAQSNDILNTDTFRQALQPTFPPNYIQGQTEKVIDQTYDWVEGKTSDLRITIPVQDKRDEFATRIARIIEPKVAALPPCTSISQLGPGTTCRPPDITSADFSRAIARSALLENNFLQAPLTGDDIINPNQTDTQSDRQLLSHLPQYRLWTAWLIVALPIVILLCIGGVWWAAPQRFIAFMRLSRRIFFGSLLTLGAAALLIFAGNNTHQLPDVNTQPGATLFVPVLRQVILGIGTQLTVFSGVVVIVSAGSWIILYTLRRRQLTLHNESSARA